MCAQILIKASSHGDVRHDIGACNTEAFVLITAGFSLAIEVCFYLTVLFIILD